MGTLTCNGNCDHVTGMEICDGDGDLVTGTVTCDGECLVLVKTHVQV